MLIVIAQIYHLKHESSSAAFDIKPSVPNGADNPPITKTPISLPINI